MQYTFGAAYYTFEARVSPIFYLRPRAVIDAVFLADLHFFRYESETIFTLTRHRRTIVTFRRMTSDHLQITRVWSRRRKYRYYDVENTVREEWHARQFTTRDYGN